MVLGGGDGGRLCCPLECITYSRFPLPIGRWTMGRLTSLWGADASAFRPERFLNQPVPSQYKYLTFNAGPRVWCATAALLRRSRDLTLPSAYCVLTFFFSLGKTNVITLFSSLGRNMALLEIKYLTCALVQQFDFAHFNPSNEPFTYKVRFTRFFFIAPRFSASDKAFFPSSSSSL